MCGVQHRVGRKPRRPQSGLLMQPLYHIVLRSSSINCICRQAGCAFLSRFAIFSINCRFFSYIVIYL